MNNTLLPEATRCILLSVELSMKSIPLTQGYETIVDNIDYDFLSQWKWSTRIGGWNKNRVFAARTRQLNKKQRVICMSRLIMSAPEDKQVDHINGNPLDNRRKNLRLVTASQNAMNSRPWKNKESRYKGVYRNTRKTRWYSQITVNGKRHWLGSFEKEEAAARAYKEASEKYHGEYGYTNYK